MIFLFFFFFCRLIFASHIAYARNCNGLRFFQSEIIFFLGMPMECKQCVTKLKIGSNSSKKKEEKVETKRKTFFRLINNLNVDNFSHKYLYYKYCCINMLRANRRVHFLLLLVVAVVVVQTGATLLRVLHKPFQQFCLMRCPLFEWHLF